ncbi:hypothetical protein GALL_253250 [mine drainage metagenome]|uniref:Glycosyl hydrolase family 32 N-terminal domain-containing protein n=1 Tax=mine drainage metagenome TaxID=410659 RepID=A0A1J5RBL7_9ZZZZ
MGWRKLGQIFSPCSSHPKLASHAANPLAVPLEGDVYRIYYSGRDRANRSSVGYVDIDVVRRQVIYAHDAPVFEHGPEGSFYADGVSIGNCYAVGGTVYMLFMGWQTPAVGHWRGDIGRLIVGEGGALRLDGTQPFMGANDIDPVSLSYPWVMAADGLFQMWYGSTVSWEAGNGEMLHVLHYATSDDGHRWTRHGGAVPYQLGVAQAFSRPTVLRGPGGYEMWFSYRGGNGQKYRIGYATSETGETWRLRISDCGIDVSETGWDCEMIEYPFVFEHKGQRYMLYNGNSHGKTGFGLAVWGAVS